MDSGSQLEPHEQKCSFGFPVGIPRAGMFSWFSCWNPQGRNVLVGFLLEFHEKSFHSSSLMPLKFQGHGILGQSQVQPLPGCARRLQAPPGGQPLWPHQVLGLRFLSEAMVISVLLLRMGSTGRWPALLWGDNTGWGRAEMGPLRLGLDPSHLVAGYRIIGNCLDVGVLRWTVVKPTP